MRIRDGVSDAGGNYYRRSVIPNAHFKSWCINTRNFQWTFFCHCGADRFWEFLGLIILKSRLQLNHVPVHKTHSAKVKKIHNDI